MSLNAPSTFREIANKVINNNSKLVISHESIQNHLKELSSQLSCYDWFLTNTRRYYHIIDRWINILIIIVGPVIAVLNSTPSVHNTDIISIAVTVLAILSSISKGIEKYLNYPRRISAIDKLKEDIIDLSSEIERNMRISKDNLADVERRLEQIISNYTHIRSDFSKISIPPYLYDLFVKCVPALRVVILPPEIVSMLSPEQLREVARYIDLTTRCSITESNYVKYTRIVPFIPSLPKIVYTDRIDLERHEPVI